MQTQMDAKLGDGQHYQRELAMSNDQNSRLTEELNSLRARNNDLSNQNRDLEIKVTGIQYQRNLDIDRSLS